MIQYPGGMFQGFGIGEISAAQLRQKLLDELNKDLQQKATLNDIPQKPQYQYSPDPNFGKK